MAESAGIVLVRNLASLLTGETIPPEMQKNLEAVFAAISEVILPSSSQSLTILDKFMAEPTDEKLAQFLLSIRRRHSSEVISSLFESAAYDVWRRMREGQWAEHSNPSRVFYNVERKMGHRFNNSIPPPPVLLSPSAADRTEHEYRAFDVTKILGLMESDQVVIVFTHADDDLRQFIVPQLYSLYKVAATPLSYLRFARWWGHQTTVSEEEAKPDEPDPVPVDYIDMSPQRVEETVAGRVFDKLGAVVFLDFLDQQDLRHAESADWTKPYKAVIDMLRARLKRVANRRVVIFLQGNLATFERRWASFMPFIDGLGLKTQNYRGLILHPQLMNDIQAADYLGINQLDAEILGSAMPLLPSAMVQLKRHLDAEQDSAGKDGVVRYFIRKLPDITTIDSGGGIGPATDTEIPLIRRAVQIARPANYLMLNVNGTARVADAAAYEVKGDYPVNSATPAEKRENRPAKTKNNTNHFVYDGSPTLKNIPARVLKKDELLIKYLLNFRDRIAVEYLKARGILRADEFIFQDAEKHFALSALLNEIRAAGRITQGDYIRLVSNYSGPLQYFFENRDKLEPEVLRVLDKETFMSRINVDLFRRSYDPASRVSDRYIQKIVGAVRWFLTDPDLAERSIYGAKEIAALTVEFYGDAIKPIRRRVVSRLERAALMERQDPVGARREAVKVLKDILDYYSSKTVEDEAVSWALKNIRLLAEWNSDALKDDAKNSGGSDAGGSSAPSSSTSFTTASGIARASASSAEEITDADYEYAITDADAQITAAGDYDYEINADEDIGEVAGGWDQDIDATADDAWAIGAGVFTGDVAPAVPI